MANRYEVKRDGMAYSIRPEMVEALESYAKHGTPLGSFLEAVVSNDLKMACLHADMDNLRNLPAFAFYMYNEMPASSQGSNANYLGWLRLKFKERTEAGS
jgi:hypothetical protein